MAGISATSPARRNMLTRNVGCGIAVDSETKLPDHKKVNLFKRLRRRAASDFACLRPNGEGFRICEMIYLKRVERPLRHVGLGPGVKEIDHEYP